MLITTCTHCLARFRVTPQQLNLRQGQVRCGHCQKVFSGFEALERFPDDDTATRILAARAAAAAAASSAAPDASPQAAPPPEIEPLPEFLSVADSPAPATPAAELSGGPATEPLPESVPEAPVPTTDESAATEQPPPPELPAATDPAGAEPSAARTRTLAALVEAYSAAPATPRVARAWVFGCALMALLLALQLAYSFRARIAQAYPAARPALEAACQAIGCTVPWVNDHSLLKLEDSELVEVPGKPHEIALGARIRNLATTAQEFPHIELTLTDLTGQAAARRVLRPADYLGRALVPGEAMASGSELAIHLRLETPRLKATGYELLLFYP
jgi:predicted Zn finger-like uncharacterized protein